MHLGFEMKDNDHVARKWLRVKTLVDLDHTINIRKGISFALKEVDMSC